jgi:hypothetical protein
MKLLAVLGIVGAALVGARPAWAATTIGLDPAQLPITAAAAAQLSSSDCGIAPAGRTGADIWVFRAEGAATVESLTATFTNDTVTATPDASATSGIVGTDVWVSAPAGDQLTGVTADVDGDGATLELLAACPAPAQGASQPAVALVPLITPSTPSPTRPSAAQRQRPTLPVTGTNVAEIAELGAGLVLTGVLLILFRGRRPKPVVEPEEDDIRRPVLMTRRF